MADITVLHTKGSTESVKEALADLMAIVEQGNIVALAFVTVERDGTGGNGFSDTDRAPALIGSLEFLKRRIMDSSW